MRDAEGARVGTREQIFPKEIPSEMRATSRGRRPRPWPKFTVLANFKTNSAWFARAGALLTQNNAARRRSAAAVPIARRRRRSSSA